MDQTERLCGLEMMVDNGELDSVNVSLVVDCDVKTKMGFVFSWSSNARTTCISNGSASRPLCTVHAYY